MACLLNGVATEKLTSGMWSHPDHMETSPPKKMRATRAASNGQTGWWLSPTPLKNDGLKVSWDDEIPN